MKKIYESLFLLLFLTPLAITSCDDGGEETVNLKYEGRNIAVTGINPPSGYVGETLEILGKDFGVSPEQAKVYIGNTLVKVVSYEDTKIVVEVPEQGTRGKVAIEILGNKVVSGLVYDVLGNPGVESIEPSYGFVGDQITFNGHDFGTVASLVKVRFAGTDTDAEVYKCENEEILVVVPDKAVTGPVKLQISKQENVNMPEEFTVLAHADFSGISPEDGYRGSKVILKGKNFAGGTEGIKVFFDKKPAQIISCTEDEIVAVVPDNIEEGENTVLIETPYEKVSMTRTFTLLPTPTISGISEENGYVGAIISFTGEKLPTAVSDNIQVKFGESKAEVVSCSATELKVKIPAPADETFGETNMVVTLSGLEIYTHKFTIKETPVITSITSGKLVRTGKEIIISGERFTSATLEKITVGGVETSVETVSENEIKATVPEGFTGGKVALTFEGIPLEVKSDMELVVVTANMDLTDYVLKNYQQPITGTGSGEWQLPALWEINQVVKEKVIGMQGSVISFQCGWGKGSFDNAKMWQTTKLPAGKYKLQAECSATNIRSDAWDNAYLIIAKGTSEANIPDIGDIISGTTDYCLSNPHPVVGTIETGVFELTETTDVVIGFLVRISTGNTYFKVIDMTFTCVE